MLRVIKEARPTWVIGENVSGLISMELDQVLADLELEGYAARTFHIGAVGVNAPHRRMRVWIVARDSQDTGGGRDRGRGDGDTPRLRRALQTQGSDSDAQDAPSGGCRPRGAERSGFRGGVASDRADSDAPDAETRKSGEPAESEGRKDFGGGDIEVSWDIPWIEVASRLCGLDDELSAGLVGYLGITEEHLKVRNKNRVQKLKALGNAIVPAVAFEIIRCIAEIENGNKT
jgi:DNA (cytosine-5)-methyltransferase 1